MQELINTAIGALEIAGLNAMQERVVEAWRSGGDLVVYSPTGSGKTLAFAIPLLSISVRAFSGLVVTPTRELAQQVTSVLKRISPATHVACCYGGHDSRDESRSLQASPAIVVGTPGRLLDHARRGTLTLGAVACVVLDEFDKSLELGFEDEMRQLFALLPRRKRLLMTSATRIASPPEFVNFSKTQVVDCLQDESPAARTAMWLVEPNEGREFAAAAVLLQSLPMGKTIVFADTRDDAIALAAFLQRRQFPVSLYHGQLPQHKREMALAAFANGSLPLLVATDLAARGLDIDRVERVVHMGAPATREVFTHRNGRTARVDATGEVFVIADRDRLPDYLPELASYEIGQGSASWQPQLATIYIAAGKREKISRGDIAGFILSNTALTASEIGKIDVFDHYSLVAVPAEQRDALIEHLSQCKLKKRRVRLS